jgi:FkbM family methyltransferase
MFNYRRLLDCFDITPQGVLHVGAFDGAEDRRYRDLGFRDRLFVEAQPDTFTKLQHRLKDSGAACENVAISDHIGTATFHVMSNGQSSSLLPPLRHLDAYPGIVETGRIEVPTTTVDELLSREPYRQQRYNFINLDVQGAEILALQGAEATLATVDMMDIEVNYDELYAGAPHIRDLDAYLWDRGFLRVDTQSGHRTWGDAIYVRQAIARAQR